MRILLVSSASPTGSPNLHPEDVEARDKFKQAGAIPVQYRLPLVMVEERGFFQLPSDRVSGLITEMERQQAQHIVFNTWPQATERLVDWDMLSLIYTISRMEKDVRRMFSYLVRMDVDHAAYRLILDHTRWQATSGPLMAGSPRQVVTRRFPKRKGATARKAAA